MEDLMTIAIEKAKQQLHKRYVTEEVGMLALQIWNEMRKENKGK